MLNDEHLIELGRVAEKAAGLDFVLLRILSVLVSEDPEVGRASFAKLQFSNALDRVMPLAATRDLSDSLRDKLLAWTTDCRNASRERNALIHGQWLTGSRGVGQIRGRSKGTEIQVKVDIEDLRAAAVALHGAYLVGIAIWFSITGELDTWAGVERELLNYDVQPFEES